MLAQHLATYGDPIHPPPSIEAMDRATPMHTGLLPVRWRSTHTQRAHPMAWQRSKTCQLGGGSSRRGAAAVCQHMPPPT